MTEEIWKPVTVAPFAEFYEVSNSGKVKSIDRSYIGKDGRLYKYQSKPMVKTPDKEGYLTCHLSYKGVRKRLKLHRLVALAFIPNIDGKPEVNHKDGDKTNNSLSNLEWSTNIENYQHSKNVLGRICSFKGRYGKDSLQAKAVHQFTLKGEFVKTWDCLSHVAEHFGASLGNLSSACRGRQKTYKGYKWSYATPAEIES